MNKIIRRLIRTADEHYTYRFEHKFSILTEYSCQDTGEDELFEDAPMSLSETLRNRILESAMYDFEENQPDLVSILQDQINDSITNVTLRLSSDGVAQWRITSSEELLDSDRHRLIDWIDGQRADGYGEGLEQTPLAEEDDYEDVYLDEDENDEDGSYNRELTRVDIHYTYYVKLWPSYDNSIKEI